MGPNLAAILTAGVLSCLALLVLTPIAGWIARQCGVWDHPHGHKAHTSSTPLLGGLGIALGAAFSVVVFLPTATREDLAGLSAIGLGAAIILVAGLLDDVRGMPPSRKFAWQVGAATAAGLSLALLGVRLSLYLQWPPVPIIILTVLWVVWITNAVNFLDNANGLCAGLGAIAAGSLAAVNFRSGEYTVALSAAALGGACLGFLPYNWPRARIFLGDTGSMFVGFTLAALSVMGVYTRQAQVPVLAVFTPLFVLAIPVLDSVLVVLLRLRIGQPPWIGDRRHINHRLVQRGMRPAVAVAVLWASAAACGLAALLLPMVGASEASILLALLLCALAVLAGAAGTRGLP